MNTERHETIIIGAGLAGLACALKLQEAGKSCLLLEKSDAVGGRIRTDQVEGFLLDRGFQVYLDAYPTAGALLDLPALNLKKFEPGALVFSQGKRLRVMDVFRRPQHLVSSGLAPIGTLFDKMRVALLRQRCLGTSLDDLATHEDLTTEQFLRRFGFSDRIIDSFFRSFYGGIFLERELRTTSRMFEFTFKMFSQGSATLPAQGMEEIPRQLASRLPAESIRCHVDIEKISGKTITLANGDELTGENIVLAVPADAAQALVPALGLTAPKWRSVSNLYFAAPQSPLGGEPIIALPKSGEGLVNNLSVPSDLAPAYAPAGQSLISVSVLGLPSPTDLTGDVLRELREWFGPQVDAWRHLRTDRIPHALPEQAPAAKAPASPAPPLYLCGDHQTSASIEGAIISGQSTAKAILTN